MKLFSLLIAKTPVLQNPDETLRPELKQEICKPQSSNLMKGA